MNGQAADVREWSAPSSWRIFLKTVLARAYPRVVGTVRMRTTVVLETLLPLLGTFAMALVYQSLGAPQFLGFVVLGAVMLSFWQNVLWAMAVQFYWDRGAGNLELYTLAPAGYAPVLLGMALGGVVMVLSRSLATLLLGSMFFHIHYLTGGVVPALGVFLLSLVALYGLGMLMASLFLFYGREAWHLANAMQEPVMFLSGFYFPVRALGAYVGGVASLLPLTLGLDAIRQLVLPTRARFLPLKWEVAGLVVQAVVFGIAAVLALRRMERRARADGKLIARWV